MLAKIEIYFKVFFALLLCTLLLPLIGTAHKAQDGEIVIILDGQALTLHQQPVIMNERTLVPLRGIFENMGVDVGWNPSTKQVTAIKGQETSISLYVDSPNVTINNETLTLDQPAIIMNGSTMVPLRFVSEALGAQVQWKSIEKAVYIDSVPASERLEVISPPTSAERPELKSVLELEIGQHVSVVTTHWGQPTRIDKSAAGYEWYVYNQNLENYFQIGIQNEKVVDIYTNAPLSYSDVTIGQSSIEITPEPEVEIDVTGGRITIHNDPNNGKKYLVKAHHPISGNEELHIYYIDTVEQNKLAAIRKIKPELIIQHTLFPWNAIIHDRTAFSSAAAAAEPTAGPSQIIESMERQVLDLTNHARLQHGAGPLLEWNEAASSVARAHSRDMSVNQYFSHESPSGLSPFDRLANAGISYRTAGENIASGYSDAIEVHHGWMNSSGHRNNMLNESFTTLGVGIYDDYYTQKFVTPR